MELETLDEPTVKPCPFCGVAPTVTRNKWTHRYALKHELDAKCRIFVRFIRESDQLKEMIHDWNTRKG